MIENKGNGHIGAMVRLRVDGTLKEIATEPLAPSRFEIFSAVLPIYHRFYARSL
jgi:hypothetical protein